MASNPGANNNNLQQVTRVGKPLHRAGIVLGLIAFTLTGCRETAKPPAPQKPQVVVLVMQPQRVALRSELPGRTSAYQVAEVRPQVGGLIRKRLFVEGARVQAGQELYEIDPAPYEAELEQADAALANAKAAARISELQVQRYRQLLPAKLVSQQDFDNAEANYGQAVATVRQREAALNSARINLKWTRVSAPISGSTGHSVVTPGALVAANQSTALTTIAQLDPIYVDLSQSTADLLRLRRAAQEGHIKRGESEEQKVSLLLEDGSPYPLEGRLQLSEVTVDPTTGTVLLRAVFANPQNILLPGMFVRAVITDGIAEQAMLVPQQAITRDRKGNAAVRIVDGDGRIQVRDITTARAMGPQMVVTGGLSAGDRVVIEGAVNAQAGTTVEVAESRASAATP